MTGVYDDFIEKIEGIAPIAFILYLFYVIQDVLLPNVATIDDFVIILISVALIVVFIMLTMMLKQLTQTRDYSAAQNAVIIAAAQTSNYCSQTVATALPVLIFKYSIKKIPPTWDVVFTIALTIIVVFLFNILKARNNNKLTA